MVRLGDRELSALIDGQVRAASERGINCIRDTGSFRAHLIDVATRAEAVARRLQILLPREEAPDPVAAFVAGAWHDGGKIRCGDDFHEIASAVDILERGAQWRLAGGVEPEVHFALRRAARAVLPGFALYEQWRPDFTSNFAGRNEFGEAYQFLADVLGPSADDADVDRFLLLPYDVDALVLMYSDICDGSRNGTIILDGDGGFEERWADIERRAAIDDAGLLAVLPLVYERVRDGCALVQAWLNGRYDPDALADYRARHSRSRRAA